MNDTNPEIEEQLSALAEICCETLKGDDTGLAGRSDALLKALLMSGYVRKHGKNITAELEARVKKRCPEPAMHRGGALSGITENLQQKLNKLAQWESELPQERTPPKAANISSTSKA
ncbi:hypothetical protein FF011L_15740 [Roseimaritima multifibrata]|uniref:Uncharacterized protein n=2 Tax=Roseimaritima multifibrata TaxID=1930274 RepID=A0A517MD67_9BACT|nr:hypothetical protein FF011L_15740 [Roseimaritima multifibrata]